MKRQLRQIYSLYSSLVILVSEFQTISLLIVPLMNFAMMYLLIEHSRLWDFPLVNQAKMLRLSIIKDASGSDGA